MEEKRYKYYVNLINNVMTFIEVIDNGAISSNKMSENMERAKDIGNALIELPKEHQNDALKQILDIIQIEKIGQQKVVNYKGFGFQLKNTGTAKRVDELYQPRSVLEIKEYLLHNAIYNKKMRQTRQ